MLSVLISGGGAAGAAARCSSAVRVCVVVATTRISAVRICRGESSDQAPSVGSSTAVSSSCRYNHCRFGIGTSSSERCAALLLPPSGQRRRSYASLADQLKGEKPDSPKAVTGGASIAREGAETRGSATASPRGSRILAADREFLRSSGGSGSASASGAQQIVLIHDHRDLPWLRKFTAAGVAGSLMSSSAIAYSVAFNFGPVWCGGFFLQTFGSAMMLWMYLRTTVARAVLDPRRGRLSITGCGLFGEPLATEQHVMLASLQPGSEVGQQYIKFRIRASFMDPLYWIWYRMPRADVDGSARKPGAQLGFPITSVTPALPSSRSDVSGSGAAPTAASRSFKGAGLGAVALDNDPFSTSSKANTAAAPSNRAPRSAAETATRRKAAAEEAAQAERSRKSLASLRLHHGLPSNSEEEQKIIDFLEDPMAYGAQQIRS